VTTLTTVIYLHGFASSPASIKGVFFTDLFTRLGMQVLAPDMNEPSFATLTLTRSIDRVLDMMAEVPQDERLVLMGSSMGALTVAMAADRSARLVDGLILMAPAFELHGVWERNVEPEIMAQWCRDGFSDVEHSAYQEPVPLKYGFWEDLLTHDTSPRRLPGPLLVFHGRNDEVVPHELTERLAALNPDAEVHFVDDGHDLLASRSFMAECVEAFLGRHGLLPSVGGPITSDS